MTVSELVEMIKELPGDPDLRYVEVLVTVHRPYAGDTVMRCSLSTLGIEHDALALRAHGYLE